MLLDAKCKMEAISYSRILTVLFCVILLLKLTECALINGRFPYYIVEELPAKTIMAKTAIDAKLNEKYSPEIYKSLTYRFSSTTNKQGLFHINSTTSILSTAVKIDRDTICKNSITCHIPLDIIVEPSEYYQVIKIVVDILDINDHSPSFGSETLSLTVSETTSFGTILQLPLASDIDSKQFSVESYELSPKNGLFKLHVNKDSRGTIVDLRLQIMSSLDYEIANIYQLKLVAHDGGSPSRMGFTMVNIEVLDDNDNVPEFGARTYEVFVSESVNRDTVIAKVTAKDADDGIFGLVTYRFSDTTHRLYSSLFEINALSGQIFIRGSLDFELKSVYKLEILASDVASPDTVSQATVIIRVVDTNDFVPHVTVNTLHSDGRARVLENSKSGQLVASLTVLDEDAGLNGETGCVLDGNLFAVAKVKSGEFKVVTDEAIDRETNDSLTIQVNCFDYGVPPNEVSVDIEVIVEDANDNAPVFSQSIYHAEITENNRPGSEIITVSASDSDLGMNGEIYYVVQEKFKTIFTADEHSGIIKTKLSFDREQIQKLRFTVTAYDKGSPSLSSTATVIIDVLDLNDSPPIFDEKNYAFGVYENEQPDIQVGYTVASDNDKAPGNIFHYEITEKNISINPFKIDGTSGKITTTNVLDRESTSAYYFTVIAINDHHPPMTASASVTVYVADRNDHGPVIKWPTYLDNTISIPANAYKGYVITRIVADDEDLGDNAKLHYDIKNSDFSNYFKIHPASGVISVSKNLDSVKNRDYISLVITVSDSGESIKKSHTTLDIHLNASVKVEMPPSFSSNIPNNTATTANVLNQQENEVVFIDNNTTIIAALTSVALLLVFVIVLSLVLLRRSSMEKVVRECHVSGYRDNNQIYESKEVCYKLGEDEC